MHVGLCRNVKPNTGFVHQIQNSDCLGARVELTISVRLANSRKVQFIDEGLIREQQYICMNTYKLYVINGK